MILSRHQQGILAVNIFLLIAGGLFLQWRSYEFASYLIFLSCVITVIVVSHRRVRYSNVVLWGLTTWALLHLMGGGIYVNGQKLYGLILIPFTTSVLRYDQVVHTIGFGVATVLLYEVLQGALTRPTQKWVAISIVTVLAGAGLGAFNEMLEFFITLAVPDSAVGGYLNTSIDLVANFVGALGGLVFIFQRERLRVPSTR